MTPVKQRISRATEIVVTATAFVAGLFLVGLMLLTTADVVGRYIFNSPITGVFDLTHFVVLILTFLGIAYCGYQGGHVVIEMVTDKLPPAPARLLKKIVNIVGCLLFLVIAWRAAVQSIDVREFNETSQLLTIPFYPFYWVITFGSVLFAWVMGMRVFIPEPEAENES